MWVNLSTNPNFLLISFHCFSLFLIYVDLGLDQKLETRELARLIFSSAHLSEFPN